ncbi:hypothetical protein [Variovorax sp. N23]|uniref:hypothetical protein n=1 Tax=Variovorax sp. N23 TaxID=2980555 RepID=UPI0021CA98E2|nr:hypothetical protein [Variovorax sp. N23]MCU4122211.1 hypothetical protein [Variovorax sp. N23]
MMLGAVPLRVALSVLALAALSGCAAHYTSASTAEPYGFFSGIWHGAIFFFAAIGNLISWVLGFVGISFLDSVAIIGRPNTGSSYYFGFALGLCAYGGGAR